MFCSILRDKYNILLLVRSQGCINDVIFFGMQLTSLFYENDVFCPISYQKKNGKKFTHFVFFFVTSQFEAFQMSIIGYKSSMLYVLFFSGHWWYSIASGIRNGYLQLQNDRSPQKIAHFLHYTSATAVVRNSHLSYIFTYSFQVWYVY